MKMLSDRLAGAVDPVRAIAALGEVRRDAAEDVIPVILLVAEATKISAGSIISERRSPVGLVRSRAVAMYLARELTDASFLAIGRAFRRHHTTVLDAHRRVLKSRRLMSAARACALRAGIVLEAAP